MKNKKEQVSKYIVALAEVRNNLVKFGKFIDTNATYKKYGIGKIPKKILYDLIEQKEITESYVRTIMNRRIEHDKRVHEESLNEAHINDLFGNVQEQEANEPTEITVEVCINFLKERGYTIYMNV